jgi:ubiquinone/menaquinone biosynthesis C-methylase UbiE
MYNAEYTRSFYNAYGALEWDRLETRPYGRLQAIIHEDFIGRYIKPDDKVLDAGAGPGRFSIVAGRAGAKVTVLDISDKQLEIARQKITEAGLIKQIDKFIRADICDLSLFPGGTFDMVICFGGALSYVCEQRQQAVNELIRVARPGGVILVSVMSRLATVIGEAQRADLHNLTAPDGAGPERPGIWPVLETGNLFFKSVKIDRMHPAMHLYTAAELKALFHTCSVKEIAASNAVLREASPVDDTLAANPAAWATVVEMEKRLNHEPGLVDTGSHIILAAVKE